MVEVSHPVAEGLDVVVDFEHVSQFSESPIRFVDAAERFDRRRTAECGVDRERFGQVLKVAERLFLASVRRPLCANMLETLPPSEFCVDVECQGGAAPSEASS